MNNKMPTEIRELSESKQRVMQNVVDEIAHNTKSPKQPWRFAVIAVVLTVCALTFVLNEVLIKEEPIATEPSLDFSKPSFSEESGTFYLQGLTLGDSQPSVIEQLGENFTIEHEEESEADFVMNYEEKVKVYFEEDEVSKIKFLNVNKPYFDNLFYNADGFKFFLSMPTAYDGRFIYTMEKDQVVYLSVETKENLQLSLYVPDADLREKAAFLYSKDQEVKQNEVSLSNPKIDLKRPSFYEKDGYLYLHGVTFGDSPSKVIEHLGEHYLIGQSDGGEWPSDFVLDYGDQASVHFYGEKVDKIILQNIDKDYFDQLLADYNGLKFIETDRENPDRFIYSKDPGLLIKATTNVPNEELYLYLLPVGRDLLENPDFPKIEMLE